ncbi:MAG TPA: metallophosphoesterase [Lacipirellulaceae bacterium]|nr:metallophosphoesterase [Lacipirellulaceae bacterium]
MSTTALLLLAAGAVGHMVLWVALINRVHALGIARRWVNLATLLFLAALTFGPLLLLFALVTQKPEQSFSLFAPSIAWLYVDACVVVCVVSTIQRLLWWLHAERSSAGSSNRATSVRSPDKSKSLVSPGVPAWLCRLPGNQVLDIHVQEKEITIPRLAPAHDGLRIAHLTDLHISGRLTQAFFEHVVEEVNRSNPDIVAITGDIVEGNKFIDWLPPTLGKLKSHYGCFYILGNHDRHATEARLKETLAAIGLIHVGNNWQQIVVNDVPLLVAGNELPWYKPAADLSNCGRREADRATRVLLAHSPDQFAWARANEIDLMMAGHLHGGQIRLPLVGAITSPSIYGVRYAAGVFQAGNTVMHVSRGVGALTPLRINCPPEIAILILRAAKR